MSDSLTVELPKFTKEDFLKTSAPFDFLYQFYDNSFLLTQYREQMKAYAKSVGVNGFMQLWKCYLEAKRGNTSPSIYNSTLFEEQEIELDSGEYVCDDYGVVKPGRNGYELVVCKHPILPVQRLINIDSGEERLSIAFKKGHTWRHTIVEKTTLASATGILQLAAQGILVNAENAKALSSYLFELEQLNYDRLPEQRSVGRVGWVGDHGFSPYVDELVFDGDRSFKCIFDSITERGSYDKWLSVVKEVRAKKSITARLQIAAAFASVILEPCGLLPFFLHIWGGSEYGKTVGMMVAASVWASPRMGDYITTFNGTAVSQELLAGFLNSLPMCLDELQIQASQGVKDFDKIIYMLTEGVGRGRGAKAGGLQKVSSWRNCMITTGEFPITNSSSMGGAVNRVIECECTEYVHDDLPGVCEIITKNYGFAGEIFVEWLSDEDNIKRIQVLQKDYYRRLLDLDSTAKQAASLSAILAADEIATDIIFKDGINLTINDIKGVIKDTAKVEANRRVYDFIMDFVAVHSRNFARNSYGDYDSEVYGAVEDDCIYIIKSVLENALKQENMNLTAFLSWAKRNNYIECDAGHTTKLKRINGNRLRCVCVRVVGDFSLDGLGGVDDEELPL